MRVSVVIPVLDAEKYVARAASSALAQPETHEVILVDHASVDSTRKISEGLIGEDARVRLRNIPMAGITAPALVGISGFERC